MNFPYDYILAIIFMLSPGTEPKLIQPAEGKTACIDAMKNPDFINLLKQPSYAIRGAVPVCMKIEFPSV